MWIILFKRLDNNVFFVNGEW